VPLTALVCTGKHCGKAADPAGTRSLVAAAAEGDATLVRVDCLSACDDAPVIAAIASDAEPVLFGAMHKKKPLLTLCDVLAGRAAPWPERLHKRQLKLRKKSARAITAALD
jgi:hypothetical protein